MGNGECKACGCHLNHADVRQLALYYRQEQPSMIAVQYLCPRCGATEWHQYDPSEWQDATVTLTADWSHLAADLGLLGAGAASRDREQAVVVETPPAPAPAPEPRGAISLDEYIDFGCRLAQLGVADLRRLHRPED